jgi:PAS domain S-box-containing protein
MAELGYSTIDVCRTLTQAIGRTRSVEEIYAAALDALEQGLGVHRASILLFDPDGVMRFKAWRGISTSYRQAVEGHTPWAPDTPNPQPILVANVDHDPSMAAYLPTFRREGIAALAFIPLVSVGRVIGKFMLYYDAPHELDQEQLKLADIVAAEVAFAVDRTAAWDAARQMTDRLRFALDAANMGTWEWDLAANHVKWSENLERIHGLPAGTFDGSFASYEREIHPEDRERVLESAGRAVREGLPHDVEYRIVAPDGTIRWVEGKGQVEYAADGRPVRLAGVCMNITRRKHAELERLDAAREASRLKDEFLAVLSHELRTPLNAILGWVQLLQSGSLSRDRASDAIGIIERNARLQAQLIDEILDVSRIVAGKLQIERVPTHVPQLVEIAVNTIRPAANAKRIAITTTEGTELPPIEGDHERLLQVLGNLLSNAVKFTPEGGTVAIECAASDDWVTVDVIDSGPGIAPEFLPYIFDRFRQADASTTRPHGGLGLGLAIARHLVEPHGGTIGAGSDGPGRGTRVQMRLPMAPLGHRAGSLEPAPAAVEPRGVTSDPILPGVRVLVVDDEPDARDLLDALLSRQGAAVSQAKSADEALALLQDTPMDLLVADIAMPRMDGYDLMQRVRAISPGLPAIAVTAYARPEDRARALDAGYHAFHPKPVDAASLLRTARALAGGK